MSNSNNLDEFIKVVKRAAFFSKKEIEIIDKIPRDIWENIFEKNFASNYEFSRRVLLYKFNEIEKIDDFGLDRQKNKIYGLDKAVKILLDFIQQQKPIVYITDFDNDGSLAQAIINEYLQIDHEAKKCSFVEYAQVMPNNSNRGITEDLVKHIIEKRGIHHDSDLLLITADNGINSEIEQSKIFKSFPNAMFIITDHHKPEEGMVVVENERTAILNPKYNPTEFFTRYNISGANTIWVLLKKALEERLTPIEVLACKQKIDKIKVLCKASNLLDYVESHPADKPDKNYIASKFLSLQPITNVTNSLSKIITNKNIIEDIYVLSEKYSNLNKEAILTEVENIRYQNSIAKILLSISEKYVFNQPEKNQAEHILDFNSVFLQEINNEENYFSTNETNLNYIERLRPIIFNLSADDEKNAFSESLLNRSLLVLNSLKNSERKLLEQVRKCDGVVSFASENSSIMFFEKEIANIFSRKFLNKAFNSTNNGFTATLDYLKPNRMIGSLRSLLNISDIFKNKKNIEDRLGIKIETPGHERAAGFIVSALNPDLHPITKNTIEELNVFINEEIKKIEQKNKNVNDWNILVNFESLPLVDKINSTVRGNFSNFAKINCLLQVSENTVWTDTYSTKQYSLKEIIERQQYGYININTDFHGGTILIPVPVIKKIIESDYKEWLSLDYMDGGVFVVNKTVMPDLNKTIDMRTTSDKTILLEAAFKADFQHNRPVKLSREQIKDSPFFKYHDYGELSFNLFEKIVIDIIDSNNVEQLTVFDVEANGFGNAKIMNIGYMNYQINEFSGTTMGKDDFLGSFFLTSRGEEYWVDINECKSLVDLSLQEKESIPLEMQKHVLFQNIVSATNGADTLQKYFIPVDVLNRKQKIKSLSELNGFYLVKNFKYIDNERIVFNRDIVATTGAYLINDADFLVPQEMVDLTGINQYLLNKYGKTSASVDSYLVKEYKGKKVLFGAHNIPYDARIIRANLPKFYELLRSNQIYDSALFSKEQKLAYDMDQIAYFENIEGIPRGVIFYNNEHSEISLSKFLTKNKNGHFPDRSNKFLLEINNGEYFFIDKERHEKIKLDVTDIDLAQNITITNIPARSIKYSVEKLSEQWMIHALLLSDEKFEINYVNLEDAKWEPVRKFKDELVFFQDNYHFDNSVDKNIYTFSMFSNSVIMDENIGYSVLKDFTEEFLILNNKIQEKFSDAWVYKLVLSMKEPQKGEFITNDWVDLVHFHTHIPKEKIRKVYEDAQKFKLKFNLDKLLFNELHSNGPWLGDQKGDVAFEDKLTLGLLSQRQYNSYRHDIKQAVATFNSSKLRAKMAFDLSDELSKNTAHDSYSFRQALTYKRNYKSKLIEKIQKKEEMLSNDTLAHVIKFQLKDGILPQDSYIYGVVKEDVVLSREEIEQHTKMLDFVMLNVQMITSLHNIKDVQDKQHISNIINASLPNVLEIKGELSKYYSYIEYNRKEYQIKQFLKTAREWVETGKIIDSKSKLPKIHDVDLDGLLLLKKVLSNYFQQLDLIYKNDKTESDRICLIKTKIMEFLEDKAINHSATKIERACILPLGDIIQTSDDNGNLNIFESNFLPGASILRENIKKVLVEEFHEFNLFKGIINEQTNKAYLLENNKNYKLLSK